MAIAYKIGAMGEHMLAVSNSLVERDVFVLSSARRARVDVGREPSQVFLRMWRLLVYTT
jgi:hypothetical protein